MTKVLEDGMIVFLLAKWKDKRATHPIYEVEYTVWVECQPDG